MESIDDQTGEAKTESECQELHYEKVKALQKGVFKYFKSDLLNFALTNIATIDKRDTLLKHLESLSQERLYALSEYLHLVPTKSETEETKEFSKELLLELIIWHMERRTSQIEDLNAMPLFPSEQVIWDENLVPTDFQQQSTNETCLALPKLGLQFLTLHDYLLRNFNLFRLEAAYELRQDIEDACVRMRPYFAYEDQEVRFSSWSRMAQPITSFNIVEIAKANVGESCPSRVRADVSIDTECMRNEIRAEWHSLRKHDIGFLVTLKPINTKEQKYDNKLSFLSQMGEVVVRGCEIEGMLNEEGKLISE
jgi:intron-binding protein aquarius